MAPYFLLLLLSAIPTITSQPRQFNITLGSSLSPTTIPTSWLSPSGRFAFGFYSKGDGYAVGIWIVGNPNRTVVWTANRDDPPVSRDSELLLNHNGMLVLQTGQAPENLLSDDTVPASYASMLDSGNFVLYDSNSKIIWASFDSPTDTILAGQRLLAGTQLVSSISESDHSIGPFNLTMQTDGNLVLYAVVLPKITPADAYWSSETFTAGNNVSLNFNEDGLLYLLNDTSFNIKNLTIGNYSSNENSIYRATLDFDGIFRLYLHAFEESGNSTASMVWEALSDKCSVKGICGFNGFCVLMDTEPHCRCPQGFDYVGSEQRFQDCARNFTDGGCTSKQNNMQYSISSLENTFWEDDAYSVLSSMTKEECVSACLDDCNCEAAMYKDQKCSKQKLPLRYGRRNLDDSTTALIKFCDGTSSTSTDREEGSKKELRMEIFIPVAFVALLFIGVTVSGFLIYKRKLWSYQKISEHNNIGLTEEISLRSFSYEEIEKATGGFKEELGSGAFGTVFKGCLSYNNRIVAVKRLEKVTEEGERGFLTEMRAIGRTHHKNLVRLLGFCNNGTNKLLVYEYMSNGSLADLLFIPERCPNWNERVKIALDVARGILYLHEECETQIIHCDIKPQNILMNEFHSAKISDFGTAKLMKPNQTRTITGIRGTRGYVAPEWHRNMPITVKADVYSFGIMLLEIICCRRSVKMEVAEDEIILSDWVYDCFETGELKKLVSGEEVDERRLERMVKVGLWCIQDEPSLRPSMKKVLLMLEGTVEIPVPPSPSSFLSSIVME